MMAAAKRTILLVGRGQSFGTAESGFDLELQQKRQNAKKDDDRFLTSASALNRPIRSEKALRHG